MSKERGEYHSVWRSHTKLHGYRNYNFAGNVRINILPSKLNLYPMTKTVYVLLLTFLCAAPCKSPDYPKQKEDVSSIVHESVKARIDSTLKSFIDSGKVAGVSALIFEKNKEVYFKAFGFADRESKIPMDRNTIVRIYSMTKPVTGTALMKLYEKGAFELDDPVSKYAPEFSDMKVFKGVDASGKLMTEPARRPITIRDITRHTAGFAREEHPELGPLVKKTDAQNYRHTLEQMAKKLASMPLAFHPGDQWSYGISVDVQAFLVERISGQRFDQFLKENIFDPLGMTTTRYVVPEADKKRFAIMYLRSDLGN